MTGPGGAPGEEDFCADLTAYLRQGLRYDHSDRALGDLDARWQAEVAGHVAQPRRV